LTNKCAMAIRFLVWIVKRTPAAKDELAGWNSTIQFLVDGEKPFFIEIRDHNMEYRAGEAAGAGLVFRSSSEEFLSVITGRTKFDQGFSGGKYAIEGSVVQAVRLMRVAEIASESHAALMAFLRSVLRLAF